MQHPGWLVVEWWFDKHFHLFQHYGHKLINDAWLMIVGGVTLPLILGTIKIQCGNHYQGFRQQILLPQNDFSGKWTNIRYLSVFHPKTSQKKCHRWKVGGCFGSPGFWGFSIRCPTKRARGEHGEPKEPKLPEITGITTGLFKAFPVPVESAKRRSLGPGQSGFLWLDIWLDVWLDWDIKCVQNFAVGKNLGNEAVSDSAFLF